MVSSLFGVVSILKNKGTNKTNEMLECVEIESDKTVCQDETNDKDNDVMMMTIDKRSMTSQVLEENDKIDQKKTFNLVMVIMYICIPVIMGIVCSCLITTCCCDHFQDAKEYKNNIKDIHEYYNHRLEKSRLLNRRLMTRYNNLRENNRLMSNDVFNDEHSPVTENKSTSVCVDKTIKELNNAGIIRYDDDTSVSSSEENYRVVNVLSNIGTFAHYSKAHRQQLLIDHDIDRTIHQT